MAVVDIGKVRVTVREWLMYVRMGVRLIAIPGEIMGVLMMFVVTMAMVVGQRFVQVLMHMAFADMKPYTQGHQCTGQPEGNAGVLGEQQQ